MVGESFVSYAQLYRSQPWVASTVNKLNRQIARLPLRVYKLNSQNDAEPVFDHPLVDLLGAPWTRGSQSKLKQALTFPTLLHGNATLGKARPSRGAPPSSFVPLDWRYSEPVTDDQYTEILGWKTTQFGQEKFLGPEDVIHVAWEAPDGPVGVSPLQQLGVTLRLEDAAQRHQTGFFQHGARGGGALVAPPESKMQKEERQELREEIAQTYGGAENYYKVMLLTGGLDWKDFSQTAVEAELIDQRKLNREEVAAVYDIPAPLVGILENATYSNITEMHRMLYVTVLGPWLDLIAETLKAQLIDPEPAFEGHFLRFDLTEVLRGDPEKHIPAIVQGIQGGLYTRNEGRGREGLPRVDDPMADELVAQANNERPLREMGKDPEIPPEQDDEEPAIARARERVNERAAVGQLTESDPDLGRLRAAARP